MMKRENCASLGQATSLIAVGNHSRNTTLSSSPESLQSRRGRNSHEDEDHVTDPYHNVDRMSFNQPDKAEDDYEVHDCIRQVP